MPCNDSFCRELGLDLATPVLPNKPGPEMLRRDLTAVGVVSLKLAFSKAGGGKQKLKRPMEFQARGRPKYCWH